MKEGLCGTTGTESFHQHLKIVISALFFSINLDYRRTDKGKRKKNQREQEVQKMEVFSDILYAINYLSYYSFVLKTILKRRKIHIYLYGQHHKSNTDHNDNKQL